MNQLILVPTFKKNNKKENRNACLYTDKETTTFTDRNTWAYDLLTCGNTDPRCDEYEGSAEKPKK